jgi:hypothetical protein
MVVKLSGFSQLCQYINSLGKIRLHELNTKHPHEPTPLNLIAYGSPVTKSNFSYKVLSQSLAGEIFT